MTNRRAGRMAGLMMTVTPVLTACGTDAAAGGVEAEVRDSAGIAIVENVALAGAAPLVQLAPEPTVRIGALDGEAEYLLDGVEHVTRLSDGTIVVANGGSQELRYYDASGAHVRTVGGTGEGPGEFRAISYMRRLEGDSLLIFDSRNRRVTVLDATGAHARDESMMNGSETVRVQAALEDGTLLTLIPKTLVPVPENSDLSRDTAYFEVVGAGGAVRVPFEYPGGERSIRVETDDRNQIRSIMLQGLPYSRNRLVAAGANRFVVGSSDTYELHLVDGTGAVRVIVRRPDVQPQPITDAMVDAWHERLIEQQRAAGQDVTEAEAATRRSNAQAMARVSGTPTFERVVAGQDGGFWVKDFAPPGSAAETERWSVYAEDGRMRGVVEVPAGYRVLHVDDGVVIGVVRDEFDVEYVHAYSLADA